MITSFASIKRAELPNIRVLIAEDSTLVRHLLAHQLGREPGIEVVGVAKNGRETVELTAKLLPDVVVMDLDMPILNGAQATERITAKYPHVKVVLLTAHEELANIGRLSGAFASLNKSSTPQELVDEVRNAFAARGTRSKETPGAGDYSTTIEILAARAGLTDLEKSVLSRVVGAELTVGQIAAELSEAMKTSVTISSVKHTLGRVMSKLGIEPRTRAALVKYVLAFDQNR